MPPCPAPAPGMGFRPCLGVQLPSFSCSLGTLQQWPNPGRWGFNPSNKSGCLQAQDPIKALPQEGTLFGHPLLAVIPISRSCAPLACSWLPTATVLQEVPAGPGSAPGTGAAPGCSKEGVNLTEHCAVPPADPPPRARSITPRQEDALGQGSMGWEEAELHKCTLLIH